MPNSLRVSQTHILDAFKKIELLANFMNGFRNLVSLNEQNVSSFGNIFHLGIHGLSEADLNALNRKTLIKMQSARSDLFYSKHSFLFSLF